jgi:GDP-L-fucose synthase
MKKIIVFGSDGFFGKNIKNYICNMNFESYFVNKNELNLKNKDNMISYIQNINPDIIINCAGVIGSSVSNKNNNELDILNDNIMINMNILEACQINNIKKIIMFSSYRIFGNNVNENYDEGDINKYDIGDKNVSYLLSKRLLHTQIKLYRKYHDMNITCLILPNVFGPYDKFFIGSRIVPSLICKINNAIIESKVLCIDANENTEFNLIFINDIIRIILECNNNPTNDDLIIFDFNATITLKKLCYKLCDIMKYDGEIIFNNTNEYKNSNIMKPNIDKFNKTFINFIFSSIDDSLKKTVEYFMISEK